MSAEDEGWGGETPFPKRGGPRARKTGGGVSWCRDEIDQAIFSRVRGRLGVLGRAWGVEWRRREREREEEENPEDGGVSEGERERETLGYQRSVKTIIQSDISETRPPGCHGNVSCGSSSQETALRCTINDV